MTRRRIMESHLDAIRDAVVGGKHQEIEGLVKAAVEDKVDLDRLINEAMIGAMDVVGKKFAQNEIFVPEMLVSAVTMKKGLDLLKPFLKDQETESKGTVVMCTVKGDIHDIGKNLVDMMLEGAGFKVVDLGVDLTVEDVVDQVAKVKPQVLGLSALLTTTMPQMKNVIDTLTEKGLRDKVKVMVGGAPVDQGFADKIGADGYGKDAAEAVELARRFTSGL
jgi:corrinoid protein of di/trimethylamine methyltransferase